MKNQMQTDLFSSIFPVLVALAIFFLVYSSRWSLAGAYCCIHQIGGWTPAYTVAILPGHNCLQITPIEFQDRGSNPIVRSPENILCNPLVRQKGCLNFSQMLIKNPICRSVFFMTCPHPGLYIKVFSPLASQASKLKTYIALTGFSLA